MSRLLENPRVPEVEVDAMFVDRWSPRSFDPAPLGEDQIAALFEAARWAPSCFNEQPWLFCYATGENERQRYLGALVEKNRAWAQHAPLLVFVVARSQFRSNGKPNRHAAFDAGAAWMSLAIQARRLGLYAHAMAGFSVEKAHEILALDDENYQVMAAVAVGRRSDPAALPEDLEKVEHPNERKPLDEVMRKG